MFIETQGLVLRQVNLREADLLLTLLTPDQGKIPALARGARRRSSALLGPTQLFAYSRFTLFENRGKYTIDQAESIDLMMELRSDIEILSLSAYFSELLETVSDEDAVSPELLSLGLNAYYALGRLNKAPGVVKPAFELKLLALSGFEPDIFQCAVCGEQWPENAQLDVKRGMLYCGHCRDESGSGPRLPLSRDVLLAMRHILYKDARKLFSFSLTPPQAAQLEKVCEAFLSAQLERGFSTLEFYKKIQSAP